MTHTDPKAEWGAAEGELLNETTDESVRLDASGFHVTLASFLTGETVRGREEVRPLRPFDPRCGCARLGALEVYGRFSYVQIDDELFDRGFADEDDWTNQVAMTDIGFNWYPNRFTKFYLSWQHASYAQPVLINEETDAFSTYNDLAWLRCQLYF